MGSVVCFALFLGAVGVCLAEGWQLMWAIWAGIAVFAVLGLARHVPVRVMAAGAWRQGRKMCSVIDIYLLIGAITALWRSAGTIGFFIYHGLQIITPQMFLLLSQTIAYAADVLEEAGQKEVFTVGTSQLLKLPEFRDADKAHQLMSFLSDSKENLPVPDEGPMKILIGPENVSEALQDTSVVVASYDIGNDMRGLIGVVGPTRMDYGTVAARLSGFAEGLTRLFGKQELPPKEDAKE